MRASGGNRRVVWVALAALVMLGGVAQAQEDIFSKMPENSGVVLVFRDGVAFDKKFERMVMQIMPMQPGNPMLQVVAQVLDNMGEVEAAKLKPDSSVALALIMPANIVDDEPQVLMIVQPQDFGAFFEGMKETDGVYDRDTWQLSHAMRSGDYAILGDAEALAAFRASKQGLKLDDEQKKLWDGSDILLLANLKQVMKSANGPYNAALAEMRGELLELEADKAEERAKLELKIGMLERFWALGQELNWVGLAATLDGRAMWIESGLSVSETGKISEYLADHPAIGENLVPNLPDVANWAAVWMSYNPATLSRAAGEALDLVVSVMGQVPMDDAIRVQVGKGVVELKDQLTQLLGSAGGRGAMAMLSGEGDEKAGMLQGIGVSEAKDAGAFRRQMQAFSAWYQKMLVDMLKLGGPKASEAVKIEMVYSADAVQVDGLSIDKFEVKLEINDPQAAEAQAMSRQMMKSMYGSESPIQWLAFKDGYVFTEMGPEPKLLPRMVAAAGKGEGMAGQMAGVRKHALSRANVIAIVSLSGYMDVVTSMMMALQGVDMPVAPVAPVSARTIISLGASKGYIGGKLYVPVQEMQMAVASGMRMVMSMQGMSNMLPGMGREAEPPQTEPAEPFPGF